MIYKIESKDNKNIKEVISLYDNKTRKERGLFVIEGFHLLEMAIEKNVVKKVFVTKEIKIDEKIDQYIVNEDLLKKISKTVNPQGVVAVCEILKEEKIEGNAIYLDGVADPGNLGTILRSAVSFGFKNVILGEGSASLYNEKVLSASQGAIFSLNIVSGSLKSLISLKKDGYEIYSTALRNAISIEELAKKNPFVLVFGNEARGVNDDMLDISDKIIKIPMDTMESLNVAVAASISMYLLKK